MGLMSCLIIRVAFAQPASLDDALKQGLWKASEFGQLPVRQYIVAEHGGKKSIRILANDNETSVQIDVDFPMGEREFENYERLHEEQFLSLFKIGHFSSQKDLNELSCPFKLLPRKYNLVVFKKNPGVFYRAFINQKLLWGICKEKAVKGISYWGIFYHAPSFSSIYLKLTFLKKDHEERFLNFIKNFKSYRDNNS